MPDQNQSGWDTPPDDYEELPATKAQLEKLMSSNLDIDDKAWLELMDTLDEIDKVLNENMG